MRTTFDSATRARVAAGWDGSGLTQGEYARLHSIRPRTLRFWRERHLMSSVPPQACPPPTPGAGPVGALRARLAALDVALDAARAAVAACRASLDAVAACRSEPARGAIDHRVVEPRVDSEDAGGVPDLALGEVEESPTTSPEGEYGVAEDQATPRTLLAALLTQMQDAEHEAVTPLAPEETTAPRASPGRPRGSFFSDFS